MDDLKIGGIHSLPLPKTEKGNEGHDPFSDFQAIWGRSIREVNQLQSAAGEAVQQMVAGQLDIHEAMIAMEKSGIAFRLMLQVRNKMIAAYEEVMRMQI